MLAALANNGPGILFLLGVLAVGFACLVWIAVWLPTILARFLRHEQWHIQPRPAIWLGALILFMICFPPLRHAGIWTDPETKARLSPHRSISYDRNWFGYIPTYDWIGRCIEKQPAHNSAIVSLIPGETYQLDAIHLRIEWFYLAAQLCVALLFAFPFMFATREHQNAEQNAQPELPMTGF